MTELVLKPAQTDLRYGVGLRRMGLRHLPIFVLSDWLHISESTLHEIDPTRGFAGRGQ